MNQSTQSSEFTQGLLQGMAQPFYWMAERFRPARHIVAWVLAILLGGYMLTLAWTVDGHITCDFGGQWMMGRFFSQKNAENLYLNIPSDYYVSRGMSPEEAQRWASPQKKITAQGYEGDSLDKMVTQIIDKNSPECTVEGALYPPPAGLIFWPFSYMKPQAAHAVLVTLYFLMALLNGWLISRVTNKAVQWGEAVLIIFACPNSLQMFLLCQNSMISLTLLCTGWYCLHRRMPIVAGLIWGGFAFKPVFAISLLLVPFLLPNWRMFVGMVIGGALFCLATLPFVGIQELESVPLRLLKKEDTFPIKPNPEEALRMNAWERWLITGKNSAKIYAEDPNWIWMSRDLVGIPRRRMWDKEFISHAWKYAYQRYFEGRDTWARTPWDEAWADGLAYREKLVAQWQQEYSDAWPDDRKQAWLAETAGHLKKLDDDRQKEYDRLHEERAKEWADFHQKVYNPKEFPDEAVNATHAGFILLGSFMLLTAIVAVVTVVLPVRRGLPRPSETEGSRAAFLLFGGILSCWHFMHYDLILCSLPICLLLAELSKRSWPYFPLVALALGIEFLFHLIVGPGEPYLRHLLPGVWPRFTEAMQNSYGTSWWLYASLLLQMLLGIWGLFMVIVRRRWSWLLLLAVVLLELIATIIGGINHEYWNANLWEVERVLKPLLAAIPLVALLPLLGGRIWLVLLVGLFLACNYDMAVGGQGILRIPFETVFAVMLWAMAGGLALVEMRARLANKLARVPPAS